MKKCESPNCSALVKNSYVRCYEFNAKEFKDTDSDAETYRKESIPRPVKNCLWINAFKDSRVGICACCRREPITINNFHAGHVIAERHGGKTVLSNLRCICAFCNVSMKTQNMDDFVNRYELHFGL